MNKYAEIIKYAEYNIQHYPTDSLNNGYHGYMEDVYEDPDFGFLGNTSQNKQGLSEWQRTTGSTKDATPSSMLLDQLKTFGFSPYSDTYVNTGIWPFRKKYGRRIEYNLNNARKAWYERYGSGRATLAEKNLRNAREARFSALLSSNLPESTKTELRSLKSNPDILPDIYYKPEKDAHNNNNDDDTIGRIGISNLSNIYNTIFTNRPLRSHFTPNYNLSCVAPEAPGSNTEPLHFLFDTTTNNIYTPEEYKHVFAEEAIHHPSNLGVHDYNIIDGTIEDADVTKSQTGSYELSGVENARMLSELKATGYIDSSGVHHEFSDWREMLDPDKIIEGNDKLRSAVDNIRGIYEDLIKAPEYIQTEIDKNVDILNKIERGELEDDAFGKEFILNIIRQLQLDLEEALKKIERFEDWHNAIWPQVANNQLTRNRYV